VSDGVVYFNTGLRCLVRLCVSVYSLRRVYDGPVAILAQGGLPRWVRKMLIHSMKVNVISVESESGVSARTMKTSLWRYSPFDLSLFLDADTVILKDPSPLFELVDRHEFVITQFSSWRTSGSRIARRIHSWGKVLDVETLQKALSFGPAVNTGVFGWRKDARINQRWEQMARLGWSKNCTRRMIDELACQVILPDVPHQVVDDRWNWSVSYGVGSDPAIIHYHGNKHTGSRQCNKYWHNIYWTLRSTNSRGGNLGNPHGDRALGGYLKRVQHPDITVVTVVNPAYRDKLVKHWPLWMKTAGLREQQYLVLAVGQPNLEFLNVWRNVNVVPWNTMEDGREACLSSFVFGVAEHIKTPYWMKLDCDVRPKTEHFHWPDYQSHTITAHRWGYTRVKGDPDATAHWLNTLDEWWGGEPLFPLEIPVRQRHGHARIASFCSIERTEFTRRLAQHCGARLPVPSQDTTAWYVATRWDEPISRVNMKRYLTL